MQWWFLKPANDETSCFVNSTEEDPAFQGDQTLLANKSLLVSQCIEQFKLQDKV
jgi:hypothetical protein